MKINYKHIAGLIDHKKVPEEIRSLFLWALTIGAYRFALKLVSFNADIREEEESIDKAQRGESK